MARAVLLWISFGLTVLAASLALLRLFRDRLATLLAAIREGARKRGVYQKLILAAALCLLSPSAAVFVPWVYRLRLGIEATMAYRIVVSLSLCVYSGYFLSALVKAKWRQLRTVAKARVQFIYGIAIYLAIVGGLVWRAAQGHTGALTFFALLLFGCIGLIVLCLFLGSVTKAIDGLFGKEWGVPLVSLVLTAIASLIRTLVSLGIPPGPTH